jgi:hypothetical protein
MSIVFVIVAFVMLVLAGFVLARRRATSAAPKPGTKPGLGVSVHDQYLRMIANETLDERVERLKSGM